MIERAEHFKRLTYYEATATFAGVGIGSLIGEEIVHGKQIAAENALSQLSSEEHASNIVTGIQPARTNKHVATLQAKANSFPAVHQYEAYAGGGAFIGAVALASLVHLVRRGIYRKHRPKPESNPIDTKVYEFRSLLAQDGLLEFVVNHQWKRRKG